METYVVLKSCLGKSPGEEISLSAEDAAAFIAGGKLLKKDATAAAEVSKELDDLTTQVAKNLAGAIVDKTNDEIKKSGRINVLASQPAEARDPGSLGEWLQLAAGYGCVGSNPHKAAECRDILVNKYSTKINSNFGEDYLKSKGTGFGVTQGQGAVSKASVQVEQVGALGGLTVPIQYSNEFFKLATPKSIFLDKCKRFTMTAKQLMVPALDYANATTGQSPYLGYMNAAWGTENATFTQENLQVRQIEFTANLLAGYTQASRQLLADSPVALEQVMTGLFADAIAFNVDYACFTGTGVNQPKGMIKSSACKTFTRGTWSSNGVLLNDLSKADSYIIPELEGEALWIGPPSLKQVLYPMTDASGRIVFLPNMPTPPSGSAALRPTMSIFGKPLYFSQLPAAQATAGSVNLLIPSLYGLALREEIEIAVSEHYAFTSNLLTWRFLFRGDGQSLLNTYLTLQNGDIVAPFVSIN